MPRTEMPWQGNLILSPAGDTEAIHQPRVVDEAFAPHHRDIEEPLADDAAASPHKVLAKVRQASQAWRFVALPVFIGDILAISLTFSLTFLIASTFAHVQAHDFLIVAVSLVVPLVAGNLLMGLYPGVGLNPVVEFRHMSCMTTIAFLGTACLAGLSKLNTGWYLLLGAAWSMQFLFGPLVRAAVRSFCRGKRWWGYPVMVFGAGRASSAVVFNLLKHPQFGLRPVIVLNPATETQSVLGVPVVGGPRLASAVAKRLRISHAIIALPDWSTEEVTRVLERYAGGIRHVMITSAISPFAPGLPMMWRDTRDFAGVAGVEVRNRLLTPSARFVKRCMDVSLAFFGGLCLLPVLAALCILVKLSSPGPIFFGSIRIGERGRRYKVWKFRTMVIDSEKRLREHLANDADAREEWAREHKLRNDPRITPLGGFLRKTSLDELPQLWNVLKNEMSLVGPRPIVEAEIVKFGKCYSMYKAMRPGITGLWQVSGRNDTTYDERVQYVEYYVRNWSPWLDLHILARTVSTLVCGRGAY